VGRFERAIDQIPTNVEILIRPEAEHDIEQSFNWYEDQSDGLGKEFLRSVEAALSTIKKTPTAFQIIHNKIRRVLLRRFPHAFFYFVRENRIVVIACLHHKRRPRIWKRRI